MKNDIFVTKKSTIENESNLIKFVFIIASYMETSSYDRLKILQIDDLLERIIELNKLIASNLAEQQLAKDLDQKVKKEIQKETQKIFLQRKLSEINKQLYGGEEGEDEYSEYEKKLKGLNLPNDVKKVVEKELKKLKSASNGHSAEANVIRNYLDTILDLPWSLDTKEINDLKEAEFILDRDHFGLEKVK